MRFIKGHTPWNKGLKTGHAPWLGKKRPGLKSSGASKTMFAKNSIPWNQGMKGIHLSPGTEFKKGASPWNTGTKGIMTGGFQPGEKNIYWNGGKPRCSCGKTIGYTSKKCRSCANTGALSPFYIDGRWRETATQRRIFQATLEYKNFRKKVLERDKHTCQICGRSEKTMVVDHVKSFRNYPLLRVEVSNARTLCVECNRKTPNYGYKAILEKGGGASNVFI